MSQVTGKMDALRRLVRYAIFYTVEMLQFPTVHLDEDVPDLYIDLKMVENCMDDEQDLCIHPQQLA